ncbi:unnamed protein product [Gulo gulo]|uniref:Uncharacterized protein n=1 Tax=Gulo gulo TaxID=48420 RepID=A0A9X9LH76_GULGU|nr:unnamed protein product [Gulo gulo]
MTMVVPMNMWMGEQFPERGKVSKQANRCVPLKKIDSCSYLSDRRQL